MPRAPARSGRRPRAAPRAPPVTQIARRPMPAAVSAASDYAALLFNVLSGGEVRDRDVGHPQVLIWGTLEARVQTADLTILGGMNEGSWPGAAAPDPWLNRRMRKAAGLLLPERRIGLAAHDYMQAVAGRDVWITRSLRNDEAETVPSRWINRLTNLLGGLRRGAAADALDGMRAARAHGFRPLDRPFGCRQGRSGAAPLAAAAGRGTSASAIGDRYRHPDPRPLRDLCPQDPRSFRARPPHAGAGCPPQGHRHSQGVRSVPRQTCSAE